MKTIEGATYTASIGLLADTVHGEHCDIQVTQDDPDGGYGLTAAMAATELPVRIDDPDKSDLVEDAADEVLAEHGWRRISAWDWDQDSGVYARVVTNKRA
ncbi:hypothetical protein EF847_01535 [Actinobacteria bacterium YIM 96077]|uniref:Uncharacterized protein n=1 Tax=Phytoactinopolyspora halophila TaxID=1981511 RepID=A0A329QHE3_9ACTN|nr:hypothetical protein [Phytoactinopolyspora halophila]AYY11603.1 hypothetical protein EF847_01535 [Actinobacteria bacterium YIM 96077]RAW11149.1 hypothetical protein DPM12_17560 [Phytoactinopolyspora halophila]